MPHRFVPGPDEIGPEAGDAEALTPETGGRAFACASAIAMWTMCAMAMAWVAKARWAMAPRK